MNPEGITPMVANPTPHIYVQFFLEKAEGITLPNNDSIYRAARSANKRLKNYETCFKFSITIPHQNTSEFISYI